MEGDLDNLEMGSQGPPGSLIPLHQAHSLTMTVVWCNGGLVRWRSRRFGDFVSLVGHYRPAYSFSMRFILTPWNIRKRVTAAQKLLLDTWRMSTIFQSNTIYSCAAFTFLYLLTIFKHEIIVDGSASSRIMTSLAAPIKTYFSHLCFRHGISFICF